MTGDSLRRSAARYPEAFQGVRLHRRFPQPVRPSHYVGRYLTLKGYRVIPVKPGQAGKTLWGVEVKASLSEVTEPVDVCRHLPPPRSVPEIVDEALAMDPRPSVIWMQIGVTHAEGRGPCRGGGADRDPGSLPPRSSISACSASCAWADFATGDHLVETVVRSRGLPFRRCPSGPRRRSSSA